MKNESCSSHVALFTGENRTVVMSTMAGAFCQTQPWAHLEQPTGQHEQQPQKEREEGVRLC